MITINLLTSFDKPFLWIWRDKTSQSSSEAAFAATYAGSSGSEMHRFQAALDSQIHGDVHAKVHQGERWEADCHGKTLLRTSQYRFHDQFWCAEDAARVLSEDPFAKAQQRVRIHLITASKYRQGKLCLWSPGRPERWVDAAGEDEVGPFFDVELEGRDQHLFLFKFVTVDGKHEPDYANRLWSSQDGAEIWVHSDSAAISSRRPSLQPLIVHFAPAVDGAAARMHLWQEGSDFVQDVHGTAEGDGWFRFEWDIYSELPYRLQFKDETQQPVWEHGEAKRQLFLRDGAVWAVDGQGQEQRLGSEGVWTLEGDHELFAAQPVADREVLLEIADIVSASPADGDIVLDVWINQARAPLLAGLGKHSDGNWRFTTYPEVVTSFRFRVKGMAEPVNRLSLKIAAETTGVTQRYVVRGRSDLLAAKPVPDLFRDPPFTIERPGAWIVGDRVRFALHSPRASCVEVIGEWTGWEQSPVPMHSTPDGVYWWAEVPVANITGALGRPNVHGTLYKFRLNQVRLVQDPAADWVENSNPASASRLVDHSLYAWRSNAWQRPGWEYLTVYQLHPTSFSRREGATGLLAVARELSDPNGYLRQVKATAILLMPVCEFAGDHGWGYNPSFFYAVESAYGGPDALKALVDAAHEQGRAVLLDVVFNHAGTGDNVLWAVAGESFFDGDTDWGAMINFDNPLAVHFFTQNLVHFMTRYRVDGFRFDFTRVIRYGQYWSDHIKRPGSGGGWDFMKQLQNAVHSVDRRCIMMAEHFPNEWDLSYPEGPMDTQWNDDFHDRLVDAARGWDVMGKLAEAMQQSQTACRRWHESTHFPESHDEVGNEPNRIVAVAEMGQGLRRNKVAAAATLFGRGIPLWFMGAESGEWRQFRNDDRDALDLDHYQRDEAACRIRHWWNRLCELRRGNSGIEGPSPIRVHYAQDRMLAFSRGEGAEWFVVLNFGDRSGEIPLATLNLPDGEYKELLNSSWGPYQVEWEDEHPNGGWDAHLRREYRLNVPDYGVVILQRR